MKNGQSASERAKLISLFETVEYLYYREPGLEKDLREAPRSKPDLAGLRIDREDENTHSGKTLRIVVLGTAIVVIAGAALIGYRMWAAAALPEVEVSRAVIESGSTGLEILTATGYVVAHRKAAVSPKISGRIEHLAVDIGSRVKAGDVLARLEHRDLDAQLADAKANLTNLQATREQVAAEIEQARATLAQAEANKRKSGLELERQIRLRDQGVTATSSYDSALAQARVDEAQVNSGQSMIRATGARLESVKAQIVSGEARIRLIEAQIEYTNIRAPFFGLVISKDAEVGETVAPATFGGAQTRGSVFTIVDPNTLEVEADVNESFITKITTGLEADITLDALGSEKLAGTAYQIVPTSDRQKATVKVKVRFDKIDPRILPDMNAKVTFIQKQPAAGEVKSRITVPKTALITRNDDSSSSGKKTVVLVLVGDRVHEQNVVPGGEIGDRVEINRGLAGGEMIVVREGEGLTDNTRVKVKGNG
ncbi:MAG TPA: efflux RND transporter periplasmic adaptor subunit [Blastocatellia bacterium]|nr:efflux RND transporter periplasmic adaptor subunit [Blastocatellia bacterium]